VILIATPNAMKSIYVSYEWSFALGVGVRVIPVILKQTDLHPRLMTLDKFEIFAWKDELHFWDYFMRELPTRLHVAPQPSQISTPQSDQIQVPQINKSVMPTTPGHWLVTRRGPHLNHMTQLVDKSIWILGRDELVDIPINDTEISRQHAKVVFENNHFIIEDLGSTNGTFVNGKSINKPVMLQNADVIGLGDAIVLTYDIVG
jgi:hypothetical protein